jgi:alcohol dehydrogenase, propanol-preferring
MKAARIVGYDEPLVIEEIPTPEPGPGQVLVRVKGAGFCHSDLHVISGELPILPKMPTTLGHENAGIVAEIGDGVTAVDPGDAVAIFGGWGCGFCDMCVSGLEQMCLTPEWAGLSKWDGGYAEYILVPQERYLVKLDKLDPAVAAPFTDAALTPYRAVKRALPYITSDYPVLVIGAGGLGQFGIKILRLLTGSKIIVVDVAEDKLQIAKEYGADFVIDGRDPEARERVVEHAGGVGVAAAFDFVGADQTLELALHSTRPEGKVTQIGLAGGEVRFKLFGDMPFEVTVEGTLWGTIKELREVIALAESGMLTPIELEFEPLERINEVYEALKLGKIHGRAVITP